MNGIDKNSIPEHWEMTTVEKEASICTGSKDTQDKVDDGKYPFFVRSNTVERINSYSFDGEAVLTSGDGVGVGKIYHYLNCKFDYHQRVYNIHNFSKKLDGKFFYYFFANNFYARVMRLSAKNSVDSVRMGMIAEMKIPLPPLPEQKKIASILSTADQKIEVIDQQIAQTQELKKGLMQKLLTGQLSVVHNRSLSEAEMQDSVLGEIPVEWEIDTGDNIANKITKGASPKWQGFDYQNEGVLFVTSENVRDGKLDISSPKFLPLGFNEKQSNSILKTGDILINIVGASIGRGCMFSEYNGTANVNQAVCVFRLNERCIPSYILYFLQLESVVKRLLGTQAGSARQNLSLSDIRNFKFIIPPLPEQQKIASILSTVDDKIEVLQDKKAEYLELKRGLMQVLLTGRVRVCV